MSFEPEESRPPLRRRPRDKLGDLLAAREAPEPTEMPTYLRAVAISVAIVLAFAAAQMALTSASQSMDERFEQIPLQKDVGANQASAPVRSTCKPPAIGVTLDVGRNRAMSRSEGMIYAEGRKVENFAKYVTCLMETDRHRLCDPQARRDLVATVKAYLGTWRDGRQFAQQVVDLTTAAPQAHLIEHGLKSRPASASGGSPDLHPQVASAVNSLLHIDTNLLAGLRAVVEDGYVSSQDFAGFLGLLMPGDLEPHLAGMTAKRNACQ